MDAQEANGFDASEFTDEQCRNILAAIETARTLGFRDGQMAAAAHSAQVEAELREEVEHLRKECTRLDADGDKWMHRAAIAEAELVKLREHLSQIKEAWDEIKWTGQGNEFHADTDRMYLQEIDDELGEALGETGPEEK